MKDVRIPVLFTVATVVFSLVSLLSCQNENVATVSDNAQEIDLTQEEPAENNETSSKVEMAEVQTNMRFGPR